MKLTREMLEIVPNVNGTDCDECPFDDNLSCLFGKENWELRKKIEKKLNVSMICADHKITLK